MTIFVATANIRAGGGGGTAKILREAWRSREIGVERLPRRRAAGKSAWNHFQRAATPGNGV